MSVLRKTAVLVIIIVAAYKGYEYIQPRQPLPDYHEARGVFWDKLYAKGGKTLYCAEDTGRGSNRRRDVNIEHVMPMKWVVDAMPCKTRKRCRADNAHFNRIEADLHNLYPARADINSARLSMPFAIVHSPTHFFKKCNFKINKNKYLAEPRTDARGKVARAIFYMSHKYDIPIYARQGQLLLKWHEQLPPNKEERRRNKAIEKIQGNRNLFIDEPLEARAVQFK